MISDVKEKTLMPIIRCKIKPDSIIYSDNFQSYNALDVSEFKHLRINHSKKFAEEKNHINGIENFWNQAKRHLRKFNGIPKNKFNLFLKECEFRFNYGCNKVQLRVWVKWVVDIEKNNAAASFQAPLLKKRRDGLSALPTKLCCTHRRTADGARSPRIDLPSENG